MTSVERSPLRSAEFSVALLLQSQNRMTELLRIVRAAHRTGRGKRLRSGCEVTCVRHKRPVCHWQSFLGPV
jgi:hypothetical protein